MLYYITVIGQVETCIRPKQIVKRTPNKTCDFDCVSILGKSATLVYILNRFGYSSEWLVSLSFFFFFNIPQLGSLVFMSGQEVIRKT